MTSGAYKQALQKAKAELIKAIRQREHWNLEVARLDQLVKALSAEVEKDGPNLDAFEETLHTGVTFNDIVLSVVNRVPTAVSPLLVRSQLQFHGCDLTRYSNPMAMIHQALRRLAEQGRIQDMKNGTYKRSALYEALLKAGEKGSKRL
jgi:hypothetical protein